MGKERAQRGQRPDHQNVPARIRKWNLPTVRPGASASAFTLHQS
jgi:hypothetical protein